MTALPPDIRSRVVGARPPKKCLGLVLREDLGSEPSDASITRSGHQGSHEFARHAAMLPFVGHEDRDLSGGGVGLVSGVSRHGNDATVINRDHRRASDDRCDTQFS
jgi:hypothetical protein